VRQLGARCPLAVRLFLRLAEAILPGRFTAEFGADQRDALIDGYRAVQQDGAGHLVRFWLRELGGLLVTASREHRRLLRPGRRLAPRGTRDHAPSSRKPEMLNTLVTDLRYAVRMILKTPVVTVIAVISLAVGVDANAAIFSMMNSWLLRPLPYPDGAGCC
jgi:hypothetical protein